MKRVFLLSIVTVILYFSSVFAEGGRTIIYVDQLKGAEMPNNIDKPEWRCLKIDTNGITVSFREKYGAEIVKQCIGGIMINSICLHIKINLVILLRCQVLQNLDLLNNFLDIFKV